ncbi:anti-sigma factor family protein [candidate division KSB1 bacterium]
MECVKKIEEICNKLGEDLDSEKCRELKKHLEHCPKCCAYVDTLKKTVEIYKILPSEEVPEDIHKNLLKVLKL